MSQTLSIPLGYGTRAENFKTVLESIDGATNIVIAEGITNNWNRWIHALLRASGVDLERSNRPVKIITYKSKLGVKYFVEYYPEYYPNDGQPVFVKILGMDLVTPSESVEYSFHNEDIDTYIGALEDYCGKSIL